VNVTTERLTKIGLVAIVVADEWTTIVKLKPSCSAISNNSILISVRMFFKGRFVVRRLGLATINLYVTKYEVSMFTHNEDVKGDKKCKNGVVWGVRGHPWSPGT